MNLHCSVCAAIPLTIGLGHALPSAAAPPTLSYFCQSSVMDSHTFYVTGVFTVTAQTDAVANAWRAHIAGTDPKARQTALCQGGPDAPGVENLKQRNVTAMAQLNLSAVDVAWSYSPVTVARPTPVAPPAQPVSAPPPATPPPITPTAPVAATPTAPVNEQHRAYYCYAQSFDYKHMYYTAIYPLDGDMRDVRQAWIQWTNSGKTPGVPDDGSNKTCKDYPDMANTQFSYDSDHQGAQANVRAGGAGYQLTDVDWKYTPGQLALVSKPNAQYGFCWERRQSPTTIYISGSFEMPMEDIAAGSRVMFAEFAKDNAQRYGNPNQVYDSRNGACVPQGNATTAEAKRKEFESGDFAKQSKIVETGWKFVRTAQTPPPGPPRVN